MKRHTWHVWDENENELCAGSHSKCLRFYKQHGGCKNNLHLGYIIF